MGVVVESSGTFDSEVGVDDENRRVFTRLYEKAFQIGCRLAYYRLKNVHDAEDAAVEACEDLHDAWGKNPKAFESKKYIAWWLGPRIRTRTKIRRRSNDRRRARERSYEVWTDLAHSSWSEARSNVHTDGIARARAIALSKLSEVRRECYTMKYERRMKTKDISAALGIAVSTAENHIGFANQALNEAGQQYMRDAK